MTMNPARVFALIACLVLAACGPGQKPPAQSSEAASTEILIGVAGPMSGDLREFGLQMRRGAEQAVADINSAGGVLGKKLRLEMGDDACDPTRAPRVASSLVAKGVVFVDGHFCSGSSIPASAVYQEAGVLQITPSSSNPRLTDSGVPTLFRLCGRDDQQGVFAGKWLAANFAGKRIAIVTDDSSYARVVADKMKSALHAGGVQEVFSDSVSAGRSSYSGLVDDLKDEKVDAVYFAGYHPEAAAIVRQMREAGLQAPLFAPDALQTSEFSRMAGKAADGAMFTSYRETRNLPSAKATVDAIRRSGYEPEGYTLLSYAAVQVWAQAVAKAGTTDAKAVAAALRSQTWDTAVGPRSFDAKGDITQQDYTWYVFRNGNYNEAGM